MNKLGKVITKILEVFHWGGTALMLAATVCSVAAPDLVKYFIGFEAKECCGAKLDVYGFEVIAQVVDGSIGMTVLVRLVTGVEGVEISIDMNGIFMGISNVNLSKIKNNKVTAIRFSTLAAICEVLECEAGDILEYQKES